MGISKETTMYSAKRVSKIFSVLLFWIISYKASCKFIQGEGIQDCEPKETVSDHIRCRTVDSFRKESTDQKVLYTFEAGITEGHVNICITIKENSRFNRNISGIVKPNEVFVFLSTNNVLDIVVHTTSSMKFKPKHSLKEVEEKHVCNFPANNFAGQGCHSRRPTRGSLSSEESNKPWCDRHFEDDQGLPVEVTWEETHEVVISLKFCLISDVAELQVEEEDGNLPQKITYHRSQHGRYVSSYLPAHEHLLWICYSACKMTFRLINGTVEIKAITISEILESSEELTSYLSSTRMTGLNKDLDFLSHCTKTTPQAPSTRTKETTSQTPPTTIKGTTSQTPPTRIEGTITSQTPSTRIEETTSQTSPKKIEGTTSQTPPTRTEERTSQSLSTSTEGIFQNTTEFDSASNKLDTTNRTISDGTSTVPQTSTEMQPQDFDYIIVGFGGFGLLLAVVIFSLVCLLLKTRQTLSKKDQKNSAKTRELSNSAIENVNNPAHESTEDVRCFPNLDNPEVIYNPAYESSDNVMMSDRKKFEDQKNLPKKSSISSASDVREEIYNPAYETSANVNGTNHLYHYVEHGTNECQIKTRHLPAESQYHYVDFKGK